MMKEDLETLIANLEIRNPLKSLLNLKFKLGHFDETGGSILVFIDTFWAEDGKPIQDWNNSFHFTFYQGGRFLRDPYKLAEFCISSLMQLLTHEAHESIFLNDTHAITPIHNKGPDAQKIPKISST